MLKLRRRRGMLAVSLGLTLGILALAFVVITIQHGGNPAKTGPAGGLTGWATPRDGLDHGASSSAPSSARRPAPRTSTPASSATSPPPAARAPRCSCPASAAPGSSSARSSRSRSRPTSPARSRSPTARPRRAGSDIVDGAAMVWSPRARSAPPWRSASRARRLARPGDRDPARDPHRLRAAAAGAGFLGDARQALPISAINRIGDQAGDLDTRRARHLDRRRPRLDRGRAGRRRMAHQDARDLVPRAPQGRGYAQRVSPALPSWLRRPSPRTVDVGLTLLVALLVVPTAIATLPRTTGSSRRCSRSPALPLLIRRRRPFVGARARHAANVLTPVDGPSRSRWWSRSTRSARGARGRRRAPPPARSC